MYVKLLLSPDNKIVEDETDQEDPTRDEAPDEAGSMPPSEPYDNEADSSDEAQGDSTICLRTGLPFQSSEAMKIMPHYDDQISPPVMMPPLPTESVFCRICREGLHDDADDEQPAPAADNDDIDMSNNNSTGRSHDRGADARPNDDEEEYNEPISVDPGVGYNRHGPVVPHPSYYANKHALENPILAPCECAGSMAFVHYLCVEQWRCRSRHPEANLGANCETCGAAYSLPPVTRPPNVSHMGAGAFRDGNNPLGDDWLDAMPPHVMQALRQPHFWWQVGAGLVRRRWLRPLAPVILSPIVALYCRARRLLKKRGVARRRWACSLCRRRARWKCVRCLRSYYCSRQCQNVSWHIVHKHVCYKPARFWSSVVVYGLLTLVTFPGILRDPLMYDLGLCLIPASFIVLGVLGGGLAVVLKKVVGVDVRGRAMEAAVVLLTLFITVVAWGVVRGFFGQPSSCYGVTGSIQVAPSNLQWSPVLGDLDGNNMSSTEVLDNEGQLYGYPMAINHKVLRILHKFVLHPGEKIYHVWDRLALNSGSLVRSALCTQNDSQANSFVFPFRSFFAPHAEKLPEVNEASPSPDPVSGLPLSGCFEHLPHANANFILAENEGGKCAGDLMLMWWLLVAALFTWVGTTLWKRHERQQRGIARVGARRGAERQHED
jgi:RING-variant domain